MALSLKIDLEARFAQALDAFDKLEKQATRSFSRIDSAVKGVNTALGAIGVGVSVGALAATFKATVEELASLDDAAETTGASVEALSSLLNTLAPTGVGLEQITDLAGKLTKSMVAAKDESSKAAQAFKALGVDTRDSSGNLRSVDDVLVDVAKSLAQYEDGTGKAAIAQALLEESGARYLPLLKDLGTRQREAATVTGETAAAAERLANAWRTLGVESTKLTQTYLGPVIVALADIAKRFGDAKTAGLGFFDALQGSTLPDSRVVTEIQKQRDAINALNAARAAEEALRKRNPGLQDDGAIAAIDREIAVRKRAIDFLQGRANELDKTRLQADAQNDPELARLLRGQTLLAAPALSGAGPAKPINDARDAYVELDQLISQSLIDDELRQQANAAKALAEQLDKAAASSLRQLAEFDRAEESANEGIRRDIESIRDAVDPTRALYRDLERVRELTSAGLLPADVGNARLMQLYSEIDRILLQVPALATTVSSGVQSVLAPIESAFEAVILQGGSARDVLAGLSDDIAQFILRQQITGPLFDILGGTFDPKKSGGTIVGGIRSLLGFASGGDPPVGRWSLVGEKGPELIRPLSPMRVYPTGMGPAGGGGVNITQQITVGSGVNRAEVAAAMYAAKESAKAEILASMRRGSTFAAA